MLDFFRRYQWYFFLVITVVIIISFSFFGTYSTIDSRSNVWREQIAFKAIDGSEVTRIDLEEMAQFIGTDSTDKLLFGGAWGPNFFNDGVIKKDILESGIGEELIFAYGENLKTDLQSRLEKEKKFQLYSHPEAKFIGVESIWDYFSPGMNQSYQALRSATDSVDKNAIKQRIHLFLAEKQMPAPTLRYLLSYQEQQYNWLKPDPNLKYLDLSLFNYHTLEDWFGPRFTRLVSEFIINTAILAKAQGYQVTKEEALADLLQNTQKSYQENSKNPNFAVANAKEYFSEQLHLLNMDQGRAVKIWQQILLFRRYMQDAKNQALVDPLFSQKLHAFASENVTLNFYKLPRELQLSRYEELQNFETYLNAVSQRNKKNLLALPTDYLALSVIQKENPELLQKMYQLEIAKVKKSDLLAQIRLKDLWNWEVEDQNWQQLVKRFPLLGIKNDTEKQNRYNALDGLDEITRSKVDLFAKESMLNERLDSIQEALAKAPRETVVLGIRAQGGKAPFPGLEKKEKREELIALLDAAPLNEAPVSNASLGMYSPNSDYFYSITVLNRSTTPQILTFSEAQKEGILEEIKAKNLEKYYLTVREKNPTDYQKEDKEWKSLSAVKNKIVDLYYDDVLKALKKSVPAEEQEKAVNQDQLASYRFYDYMQELKNKITKKESDEASWIKTAPLSPSLDQQISLSDQWKVEKEVKQSSRKNNQEGADLTGLENLTVGYLSPVRLNGPGALSFFEVTAKGMDQENLKMVADQTRVLQGILGSEAQRVLMIDLLSQMQEKGALSLSYLNKEQEAVEEKE